jgi:hypothetical protein
MGAPDAPQLASGNRQSQKRSNSHAARSPRHSMPQVVEFPHGLHEFCILEVNIRYLRIPAGDLNRRGWAGSAPTGIASEKDRSASQSREREIGFTRSKRRFTELATKGNAPIPEVLDGCIRRLPTQKIVGTVIPNHPPKRTLLLQSPSVTSRSGFWSGRL